MEEKRVATTAERIKEAMHRANMKQADLARATEINTGAICRYLSGAYEPKQTAINKIAVALGVSEMWLWGCDVPKERHIETKKQPINFDGLSEKKKALMQFAMEVPEDKAEMILQVMKTILKND